MALTDPGFDPSAVVAAIREGDQSAMASLYAELRRAFAYSFGNPRPGDFDDRLHDCFVAVVDGIRLGRLRAPAALMGYARTIAKAGRMRAIRRVIAARTRAVDFELVAATVPARESDPEQSLRSEERAGLQRRLLLEARPRDREVLSRFYLRRQSRETILAEMGLSDTQFRLLKSRALGRLAREGRAALFTPDLLQRNSGIERKDGKRSGRRGRQRASGRAGCPADLP